MTGAPPLRTARAAVPAAVPHGRQPLALAALMVVLFLTFIGCAVFGTGRRLTAVTISPARASRSSPRRSP